MSTALFRHLANTALCAGMAIAPFVQAGDSAPQRLALATPQMKAQPFAAPVTPQRAAAVAENSKR